MKVNLQKWLLFLCLRLKPCRRIVWEQRNGSGGVCSDDGSCGCGHGWPSQSRAVASQKRIKLGWSLLWRYWTEIRGGKDKYHICANILVCAAKDIGCWHWYYSCLLTGSYATFLPVLTPPCSGNTLGKVVYKVIYIAIRRPRSKVWRLQGVIRCEPYKALVGSQSA
jgi:hypothetical protein